METIQKGLGLDIWYKSKNILEAQERTISFEDLHFADSYIFKPDIVEVADGLADAEVVNLGTAAVCGIDHQKVFEIVMEANFRKFEGGTIDTFGKLIKPKGFVGPEDDIKNELRNQGWEGDVKEKKSGKE